MEEMPENTPDFTLMRALFYDHRDEPGSFGCWAFDTSTMSCTAYEQRPTLCRTYPGGKKRCSHCGAKTHGAATAEHPLVLLWLLRQLRRLRR